MIIVISVVFQNITTLQLPVDDNIERNDEELMNVDVQSKNVADEQKIAESEVAAVDDQKDLIQQSVFFLFFFFLGCFDLYFPTFLLSRFS